MSTTRQGTRTRGAWAEIIAAAVAVATLMVIGASHQTNTHAIRTDRAAAFVDRHKAAQRPAPPAPIPERSASLVRDNAPAPTLVPEQHLTVRWGQTLWQVARTVHLPVVALTSVNPLAAQGLIAGQVLTIPPRYVVRPGDTLAKLAARWHVPVALIVRENRLTTYIHPSETLAVPAMRIATVSGTLSSRGTWPNPTGLSAKQEYIIARLVQAEAGDQPFLGQVAVAAVVLNRLKSPGFPHTVAGVVFAPNQFETVSTGTYWNSPSPLALLAVQAAAAGWDPTGGALYFYNPSLPHSSWMNTLPTTVTIGAQVFAR